MFTSVSLSSNLPILTPHHTLVCHLESCNTKMPAMLTKKSTANEFQYPGMIYTPSASASNPHQTIYASDLQTSARSIHEVIGCDRCRVLSLECSTKWTFCDSCREAKVKCTWGQEQSYQQRKYVFIVLNPFQTLNCVNLCLSI